MTWAKGYVECFLANHLNSPILVVDDDAMNRELVAFCLQTCLGFRNTLIAQNGKEALEIFYRRKDEIILIISDVQMPVMGGDELFWYLKNKQESVRILLCSGNGFGTDEFFRAGLNGFLHKPFTFKQFSLAVVNAFI